MGIDPAPFWANLFLFQFEAKYITSLVSARSKVPYNFHGIERFISELCVINDRENFKEIYPKELELKLEHHGTYAIFLDLHKEIRYGIFV